MPLRCCSLPLDSLVKEEATVRGILRGGGIALVGTDSPLDNPARALHFNLRPQVHFGLAPYEALQTASRPSLPQRATLHRA